MRVGRTSGGATNWARASGASVKPERGSCEKLTRFIGDDRRLSLGT